MKGVIFTGLLEMVEKRFGYIVANNIIVKNTLPSGGVYAGVGTYDYKELFQLLTSLSQETGYSQQELLQAFGEYYFQHLAVKASRMIDMSEGLLSFLSKIENYIHPEVLKLYPDAQLPTFTIQFQNEKTLQLLYQSKRRMEHFAYGLMKGAAAFFNEPATISMDLQDSGDTLFTITKVEQNG